MTTGCGSNTGDYDMSVNEIPSDSDVLQVLRGLGGQNITASKVCEQLIAAGHSRRVSQLAIQRTIDRGKVTLNQDWTLSAAAAPAHAA